MDEVPQLAQDGSFGWSWPRHCLPLILSSSVLRLNIFLRRSMGWYHWLLGQLFSLPATRSALKVAIYALISCIFLYISWSKLNGSGCSTILVILTRFLFLSLAPRWAPKYFVWLGSRIKRPILLRITIVRASPRTTSKSIGGWPVENNLTLKWDMFL